MSGTLEGGKKRRQTMIARYGSEAAWKQAMRDIAAKGGSAPRRTTKQLTEGS